MSQRRHFIKLSLAVVLAGSVLAALAQVWRSVDDKIIEVKIPAQQYRESGLWKEKDVVQLV
jgi:hypothetical protein